MDILFLLILVAPLLELSKLIGDEKARKAEITALKYCSSFLRAFPLLFAFLIRLGALSIVIVLVLYPIFNSISLDQIIAGDVVYSNTHSAIILCYVFLEVQILSAFYRKTARFGASIFLIQSMLLAQSFFIAVEILEPPEAFSIPFLFVLMPIAAVVLIVAQLRYLSYLAIQTEAIYRDTRLNEVVGLNVFSIARQGEPSLLHGLVSATTLVLPGLLLGILGSLLLLFVAGVARIILFFEQLRVKLGSPLFVNILIYSLTFMGISYAVFIYFTTGELAGLD